MYLEKDIVRIARRENNNERGYLVVNALQGKHIPVRASEALRLFAALAELVRAEVAAERVLVIGFAETATAIGAAIATDLGCSYIQTTRETTQGCSYLQFTEAHSHATEQKIDKQALAMVLPEIDRIIFVEDELTTGNTILSLVGALEKEFGQHLRFVAACVFSGMTNEAIAAFESRGVTLRALLCIDHSSYTKQALDYASDGSCYCILPEPAEQDAICSRYLGCLDARNLVNGIAYHAACEDLWQSIQADFSFASEERILVLGTEEFMFPGLYVASQIEGLGVDARFHATTRSPIAVSAQEEYPLHYRYELKSLYDANRTTFVYELAAYSSVFIITDAPAQQAEGLRTLLAALRQAGNDKIHVIRWCNS